MNTDELMAILKRCDDPYLVRLVLDALEQLCIQHRNEVAALQQQLAQCQDDKQLLIQALTMMGKDLADIVRSHMPVQPSPAVLADALQDTVHTEIGEGRPVRTARNV